MFAFAATLIAATLVISPPTTAEVARDFREAGRPRVARAYANASDAYRDAIPDALLSVDPEGLHPEWLHELFRICKRESWCGKNGTPGVHNIDSWTGPRSYLWAVRRNRLDPLECESHRLSDYAPVLRELDQHARKTGSEPEGLREKISGLPLGTHHVRDFATRGGFGMNAARGVRLLGACVDPSELDDPYQGARLAALTLAACEVRGSERACTCIDHVPLWVGVGRWRARPLLWGPKTRVHTVAVQCGDATARVYAAREILLAPVYAAHAALRAVLKLRKMRGK